MIVYYWFFGIRYILRERMTSNLTMDSYEVTHSPHKQEFLRLRVTAGLQHIIVYATRQGVTVKQHIVPSGLFVPLGKGLHFHSEHVIHDQCDMRGMSQFVRDRSARIEGIGIVLPKEARVWGLCVLNDRQLG